MAGRWGIGSTTDAQRTEDDVIFYCRLYNRLPHCRQPQCKAQGGQKKGTMENNFTVSNTEKTFVISISWQTEMDKEDKAKVHSLLLQSLELWDSKEKMSKAIDEELVKIKIPNFPSDAG